LTVVGIAWFVYTQRRVARPPAGSLPAKPAADASVRRAG
jgi:hypothetical protein